MGWFFNLYRKEKIFESNSTFFLFEKSNNPDIKPNLKLKDQNPYAIERIVKSVKNQKIGLYASSDAAKNGLTFIK